MSSHRGLRRSGAGDRPPVARHPLTRPWTGGVVWFEAGALTWLGPRMKGLIYLSFPSFGLKKLHLVSLERSKMFIAPGVGLLALAAVVLWGLLA